MKAIAVLVKVLASFVAVVLVLILISFLVSSKKEKPKTTQSVLGPISPADFTGNVASDELRTRTPEEQARQLGLWVGQGCVGIQAFYGGILPDHSGA